MAALEFETPLVVHLDAAPLKSANSVTRIGDKDLTRIKSWSIESDYLTSTDSFEFVVMDDDPDYPLVGLEGQPVTLTVGGAVQLVGRIDDTSRGDDGNSISCMGRDYIADLVECNIDPTFIIKEKETLGDVILRACSPIGITKLAGESDVATVLDVRQGIPGKGRRTRSHKGSQQQGNKSKDFKEITLEDLKPDLGQGIYEFLKPICDRHGVTIQPTYSRDTLLIAGPFYSDVPGYGIVRIRSAVDGGNGSNNVISASARRSYASFPTMIIVQGQAAPRTGEPTGPSTEVIDTWAEAQHFGGELADTLSDITWTGRRKPGEKDALPIDKIYRLNVFRDDRARSPDQISNAARRLFAEHLKKTLEYKVKLRGHYDPDTGALWSHDTILTVTDEVCGLSEELWVQGRRLSYSESEGATTELTCIRPGSFEI